MAGGRWKPSTSSPATSFMVGLTGPRIAGQSARAEPVGGGIEERFVLTASSSMVVEEAEEAHAVVVLGEVLPVLDGRHTSDDLTVALGDEQL